MTDPLSARLMDRSTHGGQNSNRTVYQLSDPASNSRQQALRERRIQEREILSSRLWNSLSRATVASYTSQLLMLSRVEVPWDVGALADYLARSDTILRLRAGQAAVMRSAVKKAMTINRQPIPAGDANKLDLVIKTLRATENRMKKSGALKVDRAKGAMPLPVLQGAFRSTCTALKSKCQDIMDYYDAFLAGFAGAFRVGQIGDLRASQFLTPEKAKGGKTPPLLHSAFRHKVIIGSGNPQFCTREICPELRKNVEKMCTAARKRDKDENALLFPNFVIARACAIFDDVCAELVKQGILSPLLKWTSHCLRHGASAHVYSVEQNYRSVQNRTGHLNVATAIHYARTNEQRVAEQKSWDAIAAAAARGEEPADEAALVEEATAQCTEQESALRRWDAMLEADELDGAKDGGLCDLLNFDETDYERLPVEQAEMEVMRKALTINVQVVVNNYNCIVPADFRVTIDLQSSTGSSRAEPKYKTRGEKLTECNAMYASRAGLNLTEAGSRRERDDAAPTDLAGPVWQGPSAASDPMRFMRRW